MFKVFTFEGWNSRRGPFDSLNARFGIMYRLDQLKNKPTIQIMPMATSKLFFMFFLALSSVQHESLANQM
jgi:hypothetical protein